MTPDRLGRRARLEPCRFRRRLCRDAVPHGMVGIYSVVASANHMPVWGGIESLLGTNPIAIAIPAGEEAPIVLDVATSVVSTARSVAPPAGQADAGRLDGEHQGRFAAHRSGAQQRRRAAADRRLQGVGARAGARPAGRTAQRRRVRPRRVRFQLQRHRRRQHRALHRSRSTSIASRCSTTFKAEMDRHLRDLRMSRPLPGQGAGAPAGAGAPHAPRRPPSRTGCRCRAS